MDRLTRLALATRRSVWPVGSVFTSVVETNPHVMLGFGVWQRFAQGRMLVGQDPQDPMFDNAGHEAGAKFRVPGGTVSQPTFTGTPVATSSVSAGTPAGSINNHTTAADSNTTGGTAKVTGPATHSFTGTALPGHTHSVTAAGSVSQPTFSGNPMSVMNPYIVVYFWKRVA